mgnify:CR=1 FL=1
MSETLAVSQCTIECNLFALQKKGVQKHKGKDNDGVWVCLTHNHHYSQSNVCPNT